MAASDFYRLGVVEKLHRLRSLATMQGSKFAPSSALALIL
jgi:hypothetical protein